MSNNNNKRELDYYDEFGSLDKILIDGESFLHLKSGNGPNYLAVHIEGDTLLLKYHLSDRKRDAKRKNANYPYEVKNASDIPLPSEYYKEA